MGAYRDELTRAMTMLGSLANSIFLGQAVRFPGTAMTSTLDGVAPDRLLEVPVEEDFQLGVSIGLATAGYLPISIYPRWNFLILATNQLVNHLDRLREMTRQDPPKVIIRTSIGSERPLNPGPQHTGDFSQAYRQLLPNVHLERLDEAGAIFTAYERAVHRTDGVSSILVEWGDFHQEK